MCWFGTISLMGWRIHSAAGLGGCFVCFLWIALVGSATWVVLGFLQAVNVVVESYFSNLLRNLSSLLQRYFCISYSKAGCHLKSRNQKVYLAFLSRYAAGLYCARYNSKIGLQLRFLKMSHGCVSHSSWPEVLFPAWGRGTRPGCSGGTQRLPGLCLPWAALPWGWEQDGHGKGNIPLPHCQRVFHTSDFILGFISWFSNTSKWLWIFIIHHRFYQKIGVARLSSVWTKGSLG